MRTIEPESFNNSVTAVDRKTEEWFSFSFYGDIFSQVPSGEVFYSLNASIVGLGVSSEESPDLPVCVGVGKLFPCMFTTINWQLSCSSLLRCCCINVEMTWKFLLVHSECWRQILGSNLMFGILEMISVIAFDASHWHWIRHLIPCCNQVLLFNISLRVASCLVLLEND